MYYIYIRINTLYKFKLFNEKSSLIERKRDSINNNF